MQVLELLASVRQGLFSAPSTLLGGVMRPSPSSIAQLIMPSRST